jgi:enoyl-CoA hydratase
MTRRAHVELVREQGSRVLTLRLVNHSRANALSIGMLTAIAESLEQLDDDVTFVVLRGARGRFSSGIDLSQRTILGENGTVQDALDGATRAIRACAVPVVALIEGHCVGASLELAVNCDLRIAVNPARFEVPATRIGTVYRPAGYEALLRRLSPAVVRRLLLLGVRMDAEEALQSGIVDQLHDSPEEATKAIEEQLIDLPRATFHAQKLALEAALGSRSLSPAQQEVISDLRLHGASTPRGADSRDTH